VALRFGLAALVLLIPPRSWWDSVLTRASWAKIAVSSSVAGPLVWLDTSARCSYRLAGFFLIELVGVRASLWMTAAVNLAIVLPRSSLGAISFSDPGASPWQTSPDDCPPPGSLHPCLVLLA